MLDAQSLVDVRVTLPLERATVRLNLRQRPNGPPIVQAKVLGHFGLGDLGRIFSFLEQDTTFDIALPTLWDMRDFDFRAQNPTHFRTSLFTLRHFPRRQNTRRGILVADEIGFGMTRMYQETAASYQIESANSFMISFGQDTLIDWICES